jgi:hypothetical protein
MFFDKLTGENCISILLLMQVFTSAFFAVLFLQSGFDKVFDWNGNYQWLKGHFEKSALKNMVPFMLGTVTVFELFSGVFSGAGVFALIISGNGLFSVYGLLFSSVSLLCLFFGQRMARDYAGAATLVPYFILALIGLYLFL